MFACPWKQWYNLWPVNSHMLRQVRKLNICMSEVQRSTQACRKHAARVTERPVSHIGRRPDMLNKCGHYPFYCTISKRKR